MNYSAICVACPAEIQPRSYFAPPRTKSPIVLAAARRRNEYIMKPFDKDIVTAKVSRKSADLKQSMIRKSGHRFSEDHAQEKKIERDDRLEEKSFLL